MPLSLFMFPRSRRSEPRVPTGTFSVVPRAPGERSAKEPETRRIPTRSDVVPKSAQATQAGREAKVPSARDDRKSSPFRDSVPSWEPAGSDVYRITLPADAPQGEVFPDLESALLAAADQLQRTPSQPELPPIADPHRRQKT